MIAFKSVADLRRALVPGTVVTVENIGVPALSGRRTVVKAQTNGWFIAFPDHHSRAASDPRGGWLDLPKRCEVRFHGPTVTFVQADGTPWLRLTVEPTDVESQPCPGDSDGLHYAGCGCDVDPLNPNGSAVSTDSTSDEPTPAPEAISAPERDRGAERLADAQRRYANTPALAPRQHSMLTHAGGGIFHTICPDCGDVVSGVGHGGCVSAFAVHVTAEHNVAKSPEPADAELATMPPPRADDAVPGIPAPEEVLAGRSFTLDDGRTTLSAPYADLRAGDQYVRGITAGRPVVVTVLRDEHETWLDRFGRTMFKLWARREDTGAAGWDTYGPDGMADRVSSGAVSARSSTTAPNNGSIGGMDYVNGRRPVGWRKASDVTDEQLAQAYAEDGANLRSVGERFGIPHPTVRARLLAAGVTLRPRGREAGNSGRAPSHDLGGDVVRRIVEMRAEGWSFPTIAADVGVPAQSARRYHALAMVHRRCRPDLPEQDNPATDEELSAGNVGELLRAARAAGAGDVQLASASGLTVDQVEALIGAARPS